MVSKNRLYKAGKTGRNTRKRHTASQGILARISVLFALTAAILILLMPTDDGKKHHCLH